MTTSQPRIAIIGGGMAGLAALAVFQKHGVPATLYERDVDAAARQHLGGLLDMHEESGLAAIREVGLEDKFFSLSRPEAGVTNVANMRGELVYVEEPDGAGNDRARPEIDRTNLRNIFIEILHPDSIKWNHAFVSAKVLDATTGTHQVTFANGTVIETDILIGADGTHSRVRPLLTPVNPTFAGLTGAEVSLAPEVTAKQVGISDKVGPGSLMALGEQKSLLCQRNGDGRIRTYAWFPGTEEWTLPSDPKEAIAKLLPMYANWAPWLQDLVRLADPNAVYFRPLWTFKPDHRWTSKHGVTLLGDAAHVMSPFAGEGANQAMQDGLEVAQALINVKGPTEWNAALAKFEKEMMERVEPFATESEENMKMFFEVDAVDKVVAFFNSHGPPPSE